MDTWTDWKKVLKLVADGISAGEITFDEVREAVGQESPMKQLAEVLHSVLCRDVHLVGLPTNSSLGHGRLCAFYTESSSTEPWTGREHTKWLGLSKFLLAALDLSIKDLLMEISYLQHDVEKDKFAFFYYLYHCPPDIMAKVSEFCELAQNLDKEEK